MKSKFISVVILFLILPMLLNPLSATMEDKIENNIFTKGNTEGIWTFMLYFCADTRDSLVTGIDNSGNFVHDELDDVKFYIKNELYPFVGTDINVLVLYDYPYHSTMPNGYAKLYEITPGSEVELADWGPTNMGSATTLAQFVDYCKTNYPADYYALHLADHGRGYAGICYDYHAPHPSFSYALGDCLELPEIESALSSGNEIDILFLDCCLGSSLAAWQLGDVVDYMIAGETLGSPYVMHHPGDILYALSRNTSMLPRDVAVLGYDVAVNPTLVPTGFDNWASAVLIDVELLAAPGSIGLGFKDLFDSFTDMLLAELNYNYSNSRDIFLNIRNNCTVWGLDSSESMMVDLLNFVEQVIVYNQSFHYVDTLTYALMVRDWLIPGEDHIVINEYYWWEPYTHLNGFSFCFPDTPDMFQNYLWPNMYENLKISQETSWWLFLDTMYPTYDLKNFRIPDMFQIFIHPLDPVSQLHVLFDDDLVSEPLHVGLSEDFHYEPGMGIELGIAGSEYHSDLLYGNTMIYIPTQSLQNKFSSKATGDENFKIQIKTGATTDALRTVNLTVKHIVNDEVLWEENQIKEVEPGTVVSCEITTDDTMSDLIIEETPPTNPIGPLGIKDEISSTVVVVSLGFFFVIIIQRKKKKSL